jgi:hypothetical protein
MDRVISNGYDLCGYTDGILGNRFKRGNAYVPVAEI